MVAPIWPPGSPVQPAGIALTAHAAGRFVVRQVGGQSEVEDLESGLRWTLPTEGGQVLISPDGSRVVWWSGASDEDHYRSLVTVSSSNINGSASRELITMWRAVVVGFHPDGRHVLVTGRPERGKAEYALVILDTESGDARHLASGSWLSDASISPTGDWVVYMTSLDTEDVDRNGIWVVSTSGGPPRKLDFVGAYRWRNGNRLVLVPQEPGVTQHSVWQLDVDTYEMERLIDPEDVPIRIANNDWSISPDGHTMAFVSEGDRSIWVIDLP
jgi:Tol biopolymer transport system component